MGVFLCVVNYDWFQSALVFFTVIVYNYPFRRCFVLYIFSNLFRRFDFEHILSGYGALENLCITITIIIIKNKMSTFNQTSCQQLSLVRTELKESGTAFRWCAVSRGARTCRWACLSCGCAMPTVEFLWAGAPLAPRAAPAAHRWDRKTVWPISKDTSLETNLMDRKFCSVFTLSDD